MNKVRGIRPEDDQPHGHPVMTWEKLKDPSLNKVNMPLFPLLTDVDSFRITTTFACTHTHIHTQDDTLPFASKLFIW